MQYLLYALEILKGGCNQIAYFSGFEGLKVERLVNEEDRETEGSL